jgi:hypothetical protein
VQQAMQGRQHTTSTRSVQVTLEQQCAKVERRRKMDTQREPMEQAGTQRTCTLPAKSQQSFVEIYLYLPPSIMEKENRSLTEGIEKVGLVGLEKKLSTAIISNINVANATMRTMPLTAGANKESDTSVFNVVAGSRIRNQLNISIMSKSISGNQTNKRKLW